MDESSTTVVHRSVVFFVFFVSALRTHVKRCVYRVEDNNKIENVVGTAYPGGIHNIYYLRKGGRYTRRKEKKIVEGCGVSRLRDRRCTHSLFA